MVTSFEEHRNEADRLLRWASAEWAALTKGTLHDETTLSLMAEIRLAVQLAQGHLTAANASLYLASFAERQKNGAPPAGS
jgi:hypothetical protein